MDPLVLARNLTAMLKERPYWFAELLELHPQVEYRTFLQAWSEVRSSYELKRDMEGRYRLIA